MLPLYLSGSDHFTLVLLFGSKGSTYRYQLESFVTAIRKIQSGTAYEEIPSNVPVWVKNEESEIFSSVIDSIYEKGGMKKRVSPKF